MNSTGERKYHFNVLTEKKAGMKRAWPRKSSFKVFYFNLCKYETNDHVLVNASPCTLVASFCRLLAHERHCLIHIVLRLHCLAGSTRKPLLPSRSGSLLRAFSSGLAVTDCWNSGVIPQAHLPPKDSRLHLCSTEIGFSNNLVGLFERRVATNLFCRILCHILKQVFG